MISRADVACFALFVAGLLVSCGGARETGLERVRRTGVLRWGGDVQGGEPYVFEDPAEPGRLIGFEVEVAEAVAREMGVRAEFVQNDWSNLVPSLERGSFDVVLTGLEVTPARADTVRFTRPYFVFSAQLVPQAFRIALPGVTNDFIALLKDSSLVSVITVVELTKR
ncbi:MAG: transporter substrate-binding domain-containing protein, partial [Deltaproteobacteria bacterium]